MTTPNVQVRRATLDDLSKLAALWKAEGLPVAPLEARFTEFQVIEGDQGEILATLGIQVAGTDGWLHGEAIAHPEQADALREKLWQRAQIIAKNHGLARLWTQLATPFWRQAGFQAVPADLQSKRPAGFQGDEDPWLVLKLREEKAGDGRSIEKELAMFREAEREQTQKLLQQAKTLRVVATIIAAIVFLVVIVGLIIVMIAKNRHSQPNQMPHYREQVEPWRIG